MGKRSGPVRYQAAFLAVPYLTTVCWSLLTPRQPLSALPPYRLALSHTSGTWHPLLIFLYSTEAKNKKERKNKRLAGYGLSNRILRRRDRARQGLLSSVLAPRQGWEKAAGPLSATGFPS
ncbi:hypothetical protein B0J15DRAFT_488121 [Fusarium solani]|uniref:Uncharacterized protein n=1 Tax=Fusarium solani TaxID=169388 RepID=A0A9P9KPZ2_FUSSL|nr:uncharacterized protein B0J15DRAFT_488121 [Fusarium solani]KAH7266234.1 hypothetical protein B0J15DRAFT_488121 [Fusarium solani]